MKITDMNLICLEECFEYLQMDDLLNVADSNKRLRRAAEPIFSRTIGQKILLLSDQRLKGIEKRRICIDQHFFRIFDLKSSFQLLRCFGHLVVRLYYSELENGEPFLTYVNEYCAKTLTHIYFVLNEALLHILKKPFPKVQTVLVFYCDPAKPGWFNKTFPNMRCFKYNGNEKEIYPLEDHFPHLERLEITCGHFPMKETLLSGLRLNPHLKALDLWAINGDPIFDEDTFRDIIEPMDNLEELHVNGKFAQFPEFTGNKIHLKSMKKLHIKNSVDDATNAKYPFSSISFDQLETFEVTLELLTEDVFDFFERNPTIQKLTITSVREQWSNDSISRILMALPSLKEINIFGYRLSLDDVLRLVFGFKLLGKLKVYHGEAMEEEIRNQVGNKWEIKRCILGDLHMKRCDHQKYQSK